MAQFDSLTTRMPNGLTNAAPWQTLGAAGFPDPTWAHIYANDFDSYVAADWTVTTVTAGAPTQALAAGVGGRLLVTNTAGAADATYMQKTPAGFNLTPGKETFFKFAGQLSAVTLDVFFCGMSQAGATTQASITNGIYIAKATGTNVLTLNTVVGGVTTTTAFPTACTLTAATDFEVGFMVDYLGNVAAFWNPTTGATTQINASVTPPTVARGRVASVIAPSLPVAATLLSPHFGLLNSSAVANTLNIDYLVATNDR